MSSRCQQGLEGKNITSPTERTINRRGGGEQRITIMFKNKAKNKIEKRK